ncbi:MAG: AAA family ATPase [Gammaproteobacteria bacterium]
MYESYYRLREKPFSILPDPDLIYWGPSHRLAFAMLEFGVLNNAGFTVITGEIGSGKTTLVRHLLRKIDPATISVGLISNTPQKRKELLQWILMSLDQPFEGSSPSLLKQFHRFIEAQTANGKRTILIVDEAQNLGSETLEALRMLSNVNVDKRQALQLILIGQPQLRDLLSGPELLQFAQRVASDFHLKALPLQEVEKYIDFRLRAVGSQDPLFSVDATDMIGKASGGIPRLINILCDTAMVYGFAIGAERINADIVNTVIQDKRHFGIFPNMINAV